MGGELLSIALPLRYCGTAEELAERPLPRWWGRAVQAVFLSRIRAADPDLSAALHEPDRARPYTVSSLIGYRAPENLSGGDALTIRLTALTAEVGDMLNRLIESENGFAPGSRVVLDRLPFEILPGGGADLIESCSYADLIAAGIAQAEHPQIDLRLYSPTLFKSDGRTQPLPIPGLVFRSLLERWNAFAPLTFPEDTVRYAEECLAISGFSIRSFPAALGENALRIGAVGKVRYRALNPDRYWVSILHALARFSRFSGIGAGTAYGLGQSGAILKRIAKTP